jgi:hypothetical protein
MILFDFSVQLTEKVKKDADNQTETKGPAEVVSFGSLVCHLLKFREKLNKNISSFVFQMH